MDAMTVDQRWTRGRDSYRPRGEVIDTAQYDVHPVDDEGAKSFILANHYSGTYPAARRRFGLYRMGRLVGVAVFSHPTSDKSHTNVFDIAKATDALTLGRFVLLDEVPGNGETYFLARAFRDLKREGFAGVVSFSDPTCRTNRAGEVVFAGHHGGIYRAFSAVFLGLGTARTIRMLPDGRVLDDRAIQKVRKAEQGVEYAVAELVRAGADKPPGMEEAQLRPWLADQLPRVTRGIRHAGNLRYAWAFGRTQLKLEPQAYVKHASLQAYLDKMRPPRRRAA